MTSAWPKRPIRSAPTQPSRGGDGDQDRPQQRADHEDADRHDQGLLEAADVEVRHDPGRDHEPECRAEQAEQGAPQVPQRRAHRPAGLRVLAMARAWRVDVAAAAPPIRVTGLARLSPRTRYVRRSRNASGLAQLACGCSACADDELVRDGRLGQRLQLLAEVGDEVGADPVLELGELVDLVVQRPCAGPRARAGPPCGSGRARSRCSSAMASRASSRACTLVRQVWMACAASARAWATTWSASSRASKTSASASRVARSSIFDAERDAVPDGVLDRSGSREPRRPRSRVTRLGETLGELAPRASGRGRWR